MITLEKLLTELKSESLNEIVAAGCGGNGKSHKTAKTHKSKKVKATHKTSKNHSHLSGGCGCW